MTDKTLPKCAICNDTGQVYVQGSSTFGGFGYYKPCDCKGPGPSTPSKPKDHTP